MSVTSGQVVRFRTTAKASADARALANVGLVRIDLVIDLLALLLAIVLLATGYQVVGVVIIAMAGLSLAGSRFHPLQRAIIAIRFRSLLGQPTEVSIDDAGLTFKNQLATSFVPWSSITDVRSNRQTVAFFRERVLMGYIPANAFASPMAQADVVEFARSRIAVL